MQKHDQLTISVIASIVKANRTLVMFLFLFAFFGVVVGNIFTPCSFVAQATLFTLERSPLDLSYIDLKELPRDAEKHYLPLVPILTGHKITQTIA
jgi:hypothetical protein